MTRIACVLAGLALLAGCSDGTSITDNSAALRSGTGAPAAAAAAAAEQKDLAALRAATARFHRIDVARTEGGYDTQFPSGCFSSSEGAMGFHFLNGNYVGSLEVTHPQLLLYEPEANGTLRLLGVEYILPGAPTDPQPSLFGQPFHYNATFGVWALHVWAWDYNPSGIYADWNPRVTCDNAGLFSFAAAALPQH